MRKQDTYRMSWDSSKFRGAFSLDGGGLSAVLHLAGSTCRRKPPGSDGTGFAPTGRVPLEVVIGRSLACCVHPSASWRRLPAFGRVLLVAAYVSASYATVLALLFFG